jgi:hypothetical protein
VKTVAISWASDLSEALARAEAERRFVVADFSKEGCAGCEALDEITYRDPEVSAFLRQHLVPVKLMLERRKDQPHFKGMGVLWTPTLVFLDWRGADHYKAPGFLPPGPFVAVLRVGLARSLLAWSRHDEAVRLLTPVADDARSPLAAEALYWLGAAQYLKHRRNGPMMRAWGRLLTEHPTSVWAARVPPNQSAD